MSVPSTGGWQTWTTISQSVTLPAGSVSFGIKALAGGFNLNWFAVKTPGAREAVAEVSVENNENIIMAYPNPTTGRTTIAVNLSAAGRTNISVSGMMGQHVAELHNGHLEAGKHEFEFNADNLAPGLYLYSITHNGNRVTKKLLVRH
jgi:endoglucanase